MICRTEHLSHHRNISVQQLCLIILCTPLQWAHLWASTSVATEKDDLGSNTFQPLYPLKSQIPQTASFKTLQVHVAVTLWQQRLDCLWSWDQKCSGSTKTANRTGETRDHSMQGWDQTCPDPSSSTGSWKAISAGVCPASGLVPALLLVFFSFGLVLIWAHPFLSWMTKLCPLLFARKSRTMLREHPSSSTGETGPSLCSLTLIAGLGSSRTETGPNRLWGDIWDAGSYGTANTAGPSQTPVWRQWNPPSAASKRVHWLQLVLLFLASLKSGKGICFEGTFLHLFKDRQRKGYQRGRRDQSFYTTFEDRADYILIIFTQMV